MDELEYVKGFENLYKINRKGEIWRNGRALTPQLSREGYYYVRLSKEGVPFKSSIHRLLAIQYIPNPNNLPQVDHIDREKLNNSLENLHWVSCSENMYNKSNCVAKLTPEQALERYERMRERDRKFKEERRLSLGIPKKLFVKDMTPEQLAERHERRKMLDRISAQKRKEAIQSLKAEHSV